MNTKLNTARFSFDHRDIKQLFEEHVYHVAEYAGSDQASPAVANSSCTVGCTSDGGRIDSMDHRRNGRGDVDRTSLAISHSKSFVLFRSSIRLHQQELRPIPSKHRFEHVDVPCSHNITPFNHYGRCSGWMVAATFDQVDFGQDSVGRHGRMKSINMYMQIKYAGPSVLEPVEDRAVGTDTFRQTHTNT